MLVILIIASLSHIISLAWDCSASIVIIWAPVSCTWFFEAPYPLAAVVDFCGYDSTFMLAQSDP